MGRIVAVAPFSIPDEILPNPQDDTWSAFSVEFCGGTHLSNTSEIQNIVILQEEGIAKGIRRITAVTMMQLKKPLHKVKNYRIDCNMHQLHCQWINLKMKLNF